MGSLGKQKGAHFERHVCQRLSLWATNMTREDIFWRSAMSGGRANLESRKLRGAEFSAQAGDITAIHSIGEALLDHFMIECKFYKRLDLDALCYDILGAKRELWMKPLEEACRFEKHPLVVAKQNSRPELVFTTREGSKLLRECAGRHEFPVVATFPLLGMYVHRFVDLLTGVSYSRLRRSLKTDPRPLARTLRWRPTSH